MVSCRFSLKPIHWYSEFSRIGAVHGTNGQVWTRKWDAPTEDRNLRSKECEWLVKGEEHFSHQEVDYTDPFTKHALTIYWMVTLNILNMYQFHVAKSFIFQTPISGISFMRFREIRFRRPHLGTSPVWQTCDGSPQSDRYRHLKWILQVGQKSPGKTTDTVMLIYVNLT